MLLCHFPLWDSAASLENAKCELKGKSEISCWKKKKDKNFKVEMSIDDSFCCCYLCYLLWLCFQTHSQLYWLMYQRYTFLTTWWRCSPMIWRLNWLWSAEASFVFTVLVEFPFVRQGFCFVDFVLLLNWLSQCQFVDWFVGSVFVNWFSSLNSFVCLSSFFTLRRFVCVRVRVSC